MTRNALILVVVGTLAAAGCQRGRQEPSNGEESRAATDSRQAETAKHEDAAGEKEVAAFQQDKGKEGKAEKVPARPAPLAASVRLGKKQVVTLSPRKPLTEEERKVVKGLISSLAKVDSPDFGISPTLTGHSFAPVAGQSQTGMLLLTDHKIQPSAALKKLVEIGPRALAFLLEALDDRTPTKLEVEHKDLFGGMWFANEVWGNPVNPIERQVLSKRNRPKEGFLPDSIESYTIKVGDVCFVAIGQIVGRKYSCVRYQPTNCIVINSPTHDAQLCAEVRAIWSSKGPTKMLLDSLLTDYATEGVFNGKSLDGWSVGSALQTEAALRLLYYWTLASKM